MHILIVIGIYIILSVSLNLIVGYTGLLSLGQAAFYGIGAYCAALLALNFHTPFVLNLFCTVVFVAFVGFIIAVPTLRLRDDYFVIATFALQEITYSILNNAVSITGGPSGLSAIPQPSIFGWELTSNLDFLMAVTIICMIILGVSRSIVNSPFGRVLKAIREDEIFIMALGKNIAVFKVLIFLFCASMASVAGVIYANYISFIDPTSFTMMESIFIISIVIIGGAGNIWGSVLAAAVLVILPEALRFLGMPSAIAANMRQIIYGALLVIFMLFRPQGFIGEYSFRK